jgi:hypothetical protein
VYVLALGASTLVAIAGLSVVALTRAQGRADDAARDSGLASVHAQAGVELAAVLVNSTDDWRTRFAHNVPIEPFTIDRASVTLLLSDEADGDLANDPSQPVRVTAVARIGSATRALSARLTPSGGAGLDVLRAAAFAGGAVSTSGPGPIVGGVVFSNTSVSVGCPFTGDVEAPTVASSSFINGRVTTNAPPRTMPSPSAMLALRGRATALSYTAIDGRLEETLLTPASNAFGPTNPEGIYAIEVPAGRTLAISRSRLRATLLITLNTDSDVQLRNELLWEPGSPGLPAMIVAGASSKGVDFDLADSELTEGGTRGNLNPAGSPYQGVSNTTETDRYPSVCRGVFHVLNASTPVTVRGGTSIVGSLIVAGPLTLGGKAMLAPDPSLVDAPPTGYARTTGVRMVIDPGSYRWEVQGAMGPTGTITGR